MWCHGGNWEAAGIYAGKSVSYLGVIGPAYQQAWNYQIQKFSPGALTVISYKFNIIQYYYLQPHKKSGKP